MPMAQSRFKKVKGQSLIELLIALTVGIILIGSAATLIAVTLRSSTHNKFVQPAVQLAHDLLDKVAVFSETRWYCPNPPELSACGGPTGTYYLGIYNLTKGPPTPTPPFNGYFLSTTTGQFIWQKVIPGISEDIRNFDGVTYNRYFYVEDVCRSSGVELAGAVSPPATCSSGIPEDPSTQKVTVVVHWQQAGEDQQILVSKFLTRNQNRVFVQTDWTGGAIANEVITSPNNRFHSATPNINYTGTPGSIYVQ